MCLVGFPPSADLAQLVLSWKPRHSGSTSSVYCQTAITYSSSNNNEASVPAHDTSKSSTQRSRKKLGRTISECLKLRDEAKAAVTTSDDHSSLLASPAETDVLPSVVCTSSPTLSATDLHGESYSPTSLESDVRRVDFTDVEKSQNLLTAAAECQQRQNVDNTHLVTAADEPMSDVLPVASSQQHSVVTSEVGALATDDAANSVNTWLSTGVSVTAAICCSTGQSTDDNCTAAVSSDGSMLLLPSSTQQQPTVVPTSAVSTYRVTERVTSGTVLVDMDIGSNVLGSGLVYGTFVYHGGRLVLGQSRQHYSSPSVSLLPLVPEVNMCHAPPVYFLAGAQPVAAPSANVYAVTVPSEAVLSGLSVVCNGISNVIDDSRLPVNVSDVESHASLATESHTPAADGTTSSSTESDSKISKKSVRPIAVNTNSSLTEETPGVSETDTSATAAEAEAECGIVEANSSSIPVSTPVTVTISTADVAAGGACEMTDVNTEIVAQSSAVPVVPSTPVLLQASSAGIHERLDATGNRNSLAASSSTTVPNTQFVAATDCVVPQFSTAVLSCADVLAGSSFIPSDLQQGNCSIRGETTASARTEILHPPQQGTKRKLVSQSVDECSSKTKVCRMDSEKRISKYICPPPDSASDKDSEIIHVMDRFCDKSLERYFCPMSDCTASSQQHSAAELFHSISEAHAGMVNIIPGTVGHGYNCSGKHPARLSASSVSLSGILNHEHMQTHILCNNQSEASHIHWHETGSRVGTAPTNHGRGFALANFLSTTTAPSMLIVSQQSSLVDNPPTSKNDQREKNEHSMLMEPVQTENQTFVPISKISNSTGTCDSASNILPDDLSLTDNDFAMILSDTDDSSMFSFPLRKSVDNNYWSIGFGSVSGRLRDKAKDGPIIEPLHASAEDLYHSIVPVFREHNYMPETDYIIGEHIDLGSKVGFNVSSLTCKTSSVCRASSSVQTANSLLSSTLCQTSVNIPVSYSTISQHNEASPDPVNSQNQLKQVSPTQASNVMCSAVQSSARGGIFSLAHHAVQPVSKSPAANLSGSEVAQSASILWSPCNGPAHKSSQSSDTLSAEHRQSVSTGRQCRLPSSAITDVHWRMPQPSDFGPLYNSWSDNLYCNVPSLARPRPFMDETANTQSAACNVQSVFNHVKLHSVSDVNRGEKFRGMWPDDDFCPFVSNRGKPTSSKHVNVNCQFSTHQKAPDSSSSSGQQLWTYAECGIAPESYLSTSRGWLPVNSSDTSTSITFDLSLSVPATSCLPASTCRLPSFSFATVPPVPDFLTLSFASTSANTSAGGTGSEASTWLVTSTTTAVSTSASHGWSPIFPQHVSLQSRNLVSTNSSFGTSVSTMSSRPDSHLDVTYTVPSFIHSDKESRKHPSTFNTHLPSYTLWHGNEHADVCQLPPFSAVNSDAQLLPIHGRGGLYTTSSEAGFITNSLTSPPLHHHPMYSNQQTGIYGTGEKQATFNAPPFSLPRFPLTSQVLTFSGSSLETICPAVRPLSSHMYYDASVNAGNVTMPTEADGHHSQNISQPRPVPRSANMKRSSKYPKQLKHNATSLCVGYPAHQSSSMPADIPTYLPAGPFVGSSSFEQKSRSSQNQVHVPFGSVFGSCSLRHGLAAGEFPKTQSIATTTVPQTTASLSSQRPHNFGIGAFISELSSNSAQVVTAPAAIRRIDFPVPTVHVLPQQVGGTLEHYQPPMEWNQPAASDHASHNVALHNLSINNLLADNPYPGFTHRYEGYSDSGNHHSTSAMPALDVPTLNFSIRSQTPAVNFDRLHNTKARHT